MSTYTERATRTELHPGAIAAWEWLFDVPPTEPIDVGGGALDPGGYCMKLAEAVADGTDLPPWAKDVPTQPDSAIVHAVSDALERKRAQP